MIDPGWTQSPEAKLESRVSVKKSGDGYHYTVEIKPTDGRKLSIPMHRSTKGFSSSAAATKAGREMEERVQKYEVFKLQQQDHSRTQTIGH
jgi:hypothetical protein